MQTQTDLDRIETTAPLGRRPDRGSLLRGLAGILTAMAAVLSAVGGLYAAGVLRSATPIASVSSAPPSAIVSTMDCAQVVHPPYGSATRTAILDAARVHDGYAGRYDVKDIARLGDLAYVEIAPLTTGDYAADVIEYGPAGWTWRWKGAVGAEPGDPTFPTEFTASAQRVLTCPA